MHRFDAELWLWEGDAPWCFVTLPADLSDDVEEQVGPRPGFGAVRVEVTVGATTWRTSMFPDRKRGAFLLPVKKDVRRREGLDVGDVVSVGLQVL
jgi:hypothetical protein